VREAAAVAGGFVAVIVIFTLLGGGKLNLGTSPQGPFAQFGFQGPSFHG
jgi:hypothetical protein